MKRQHRHAGGHDQLLDRATEKCVTNSNQRESALDGPAFLFPCEQPLA